MNDHDAYRTLHVRPDAHQLVVQAAYRVLAALYHPDRGESLASTRRMAELNDAYAKVRTLESRAAYDVERQRAPQPGPVVTPPARPRPGREATTPRRGVIDFGRYQGWTIGDVARHDPDYLRWLSRHSAGMRFKSEIEKALASMPTGPSASERIFGHR